MSDFDQVVGQFVSGTRRSSVSHAFLWQNGGFTLLRTLGGINAIANAINHAGQIVGWSSTSAGFTHATLWQGGGVFDLGTLPGGGGSQAFAVNNNNQAAGNASDPTSGNTHAALFQNGGVTDLGVPFGFASSTANAINDQGVAVGSATVGSYRGITHAFIAQNGSNIDLNRLVPGNSGSWVLISASGINDAGIIVGSGTTNGVHHAFLLTPTTAVTVPAAPIDLTQSSGNRVVNLNWMPSFGATAYNVKRGTTSTGPFSTIATVNGSPIPPSSIARSTTTRLARSIPPGKAPTPASSAPTRRAYRRRRPS